MRILIFLIACIPVYLSGILVWMAFYIERLENKSLKLNIKFMTAKAALAKHLLLGHVLNIKNCFNLIGLTNCPREISRMIETPFGVKVTRIPREGRSRYGQSVTWFDYKLDRKILDNQEGIQKMIQYVLDNTEPKTDFELKEMKALSLSKSTATSVTQKQPELFSLTDK